MVLATPSSSKPSQAKKLRKVCNADAKYTGVPLNDTLMPGQNSVLGIMFRFLQNGIGKTADIETTFLQLAIRKAIATSSDFSGDLTLFKRLISMSL